ncbi:MAG: glycosyltransferase, partial [Clostridia bacterium]|nr:glycosyltransferase [Clostridia bacterium]
MLVSIITVCYNSEKTVRKTVESVLEQTYGNIEYIVVDGRSTDGTVDAVREYAPAFSEKGISLRIVSEKDRGIYDA